MTLPATPPQPASAALAHTLRAEVYRLRQRTRCRQFPVGAYLYLLDRGGVPRDGPSEDLLAPAREGSPVPLDHALRVDLLARGLAVALAANGAGRSSPAPDRAALVLVRPGAPEPSDDDLGWWRAWQVACGITAVSVAGAYAVTRSGWVDVRQGAPVLVPRSRRIGQSQRADGRRPAA